LSDVVTVRNNRVARLKLTPLWEDANFLIVSADSIPNGAVLATSPLDYAVEGAKITLIDEHGEPTERSKEPKGKKSLNTAQLEN